MNELFNQENMGSVGSIIKNPTTLKTVIQEILATKESRIQEIQKPEDKIAFYTAISNLHSEVGHYSYSDIKSLITFYLSSQIDKNETSFGGM